MSFTRCVKQLKINYLFLIKKLVHLGYLSDLKKSFMNLKKHGAQLRVLVQLNNILVSIYKKNYQSCQILKRSSYFSSQNV